MVPNTIFHIYEMQGRTSRLPDFSGTCNERRLLHCGRRGGGGFCSTGVNKIIEASLVLRQTQTGAKCCIAEIVPPSHEVYLQIFACQANVCCPTQCFLLKPCMQLPLVCVHICKCACMLLCKRERYRYNEMLVVKVTACDKS